jgi:leader peptidase (prepilin peptidase)/N-methyltransferase
MNLLAVLPVFCVGLVVGSFLNVVIHRLPRGKSIVRPRSSCTSCGTPIRWYENIPVMSYVVLWGRCSACGARISPRYPVIELIGGILAVLVFSRYGLSVHTLFGYSFVMALLAVTVIDWEHRIIPDEISISFILVGVSWSFFNPIVSPWESALGALIGGGGLYAVGLIYRLLRKVEGMGGGDIKLMAMIGAFLGLKLVLPVIVIASFAGSVYGVFILRRGGGGRAAVAFGSFLAPAAALCLFYGTPILAWYFGRF